MAASKKCSRCGKPGHNRRTCGKTVVGNIPKPVKLSRTVNRSSRRTALDAVWEKIAPHTQPADPNPGTDPLNAESLSTWWRLSHRPGHDGKYGVWDVEDTKLLMGIIRQAGRESGFTPKEAQKFLLTFNTKVRRKICAKPDLPYVFLAAAMKDPAPTVRETVAGQPHTPTAALDIMGCDRHHNVVAAVACNPLTPASTLDTIYREWVADSDDQPRGGFGIVLNQLMQNPNLSTETIRKIAQLRMYSHGPRKDLAHILSHPNCPVELLHREAEQLLAASDSSYVDEPLALSILANPNCPPKFFAQADPKNSFHFRAMMKNPNLPPDFAVQLWDTRVNMGRLINAATFSAVSKNLYLPAELYRRAYLHKECPRRLIPELESLEKTAKMRQKHMGQRHS